MVEHYRNNGYNTLPFENTSINWMVVTGMNLGANNVGTVGANTSSVILEVEDGQENVVDNIQLAGSNYVGVPASGGTLVLIQLTHKMLVPPGGSVETPAAIVSSIQVMEALDTTDKDGRNSLENALLIPS